MDRALNFKLVSQDFTIVIKLLDRYCHVASLKMGCHGYSSRPATWTCPCNMFQQLWHVWYVSILFWIEFNHFFWGIKDLNNKHSRQPSKKVGLRRSWSGLQVSLPKSPLSLSWLGNINRCACCMVRPRHHCEGHGWKHGSGHHEQFRYANKLLTSGMTSPSFQLSLHDVWPMEGMKLHDQWCMS